MDSVANGVYASEIEDGRVRSTSVGALTFHTPGNQDLITCKPINLTWTGGVPPYQFSIAPFDLSGDPVTDSWAQYTTQHIRNIPNTWYFWTPNFPAGLEAHFKLFDNSTGSPAEGSQVIIHGEDDSCLPIRPLSFGFSATTPPSSATSTGISTSATTTAPPSAEAVPAAPSGARMSKGAVAGIAIGAGLAVLAAIVVARLYKRKTQACSHQDPGPRFVTQVDQYPSQLSSQYQHSLVSPTNVGVAKHMPRTEETARPTNAGGRAEVGNHTPPSDATGATAPSSSAGGRGKLARDRPPADVASTSALPFVTTVTSTDAAPGTSTAHAALPPALRVPRVESDGGVRLAGGGWDDDDADAFGEAESTLPPPYSPYYQSRP
ncbi:hypothetical protein C8Q77DRAFT_1071716 [Trametes polyzona]|nr:hypothetical protein C8Q77DRAFT_1071716 [Trametes polyzona]